METLVVEDDEMVETENAQEVQTDALLVVEIDAAVDVVKVLEIITEATEDEEAKIDQHAQDEAKVETKIKAHLKLRILDLDALEEKIK